MIVATPPVLGHLAALADPTRSRLLLLLDGHELTVSELCAILQLPQSSVSRHLKALLDSGWITARAEGTSRYYSIARQTLDPAARSVWPVVREQISASPMAAEDQRRLEAALTERRAKSQEFFSASVSRWDRMRDELFGQRFLLSAMAALARPDWLAGDLGCGTGEVSCLLAPFVKQVIGVDASAEMLAAARDRVGSAGNVDLRQGDLEALPVDDASLDVATLMLVLHHVAEPERAVAEVGRVLKPGGQLILVDMLPHDRENYRQQMGHVWLGFAGEYITRTLTQGGLTQPRIVPLAPDPRAKGPGLFIATARKENPIGNSH